MNGDRLVGNVPLLGIHGGWLGEPAAKSCDRLPIGGKSDSSVKD